MEHLREAESPASNLRHDQPVRVLVWNENVHETTQPHIREIYPTGIHGAIAEGIKPHLPSGSSVTTATLADPDQGLSDALLADTDVLTWWGHKAHDDVSDETVDRVRDHVYQGMGLLVLHSGHYSKIFKTLMGTSCSLNWRDDGDRELVWTVAPAHPIADGIELPIDLPAQETYAEYFDIPDPDELIFISSFAGGEVFRSGVTFRRGAGKIFYFSPGDQEYPVYHHPSIRRVIANGVCWAARRRRVPSPTANHIPNQKRFG